MRGWASIPGIPAGPGTPVLLDWRRPLARVGSEPAVEQPWTPQYSRKTISEQCQAALEQFDFANAEDPNAETVNGETLPSALVYGHRMSRRLDDFAPDASEEVKLAARAQHLRRWTIQRSDFPQGIKGYNQWRRAMALFHAEKAGEILREVGYEKPLVSRVQTLLRRERRTSDAEVQQLEDVACLVFLEHYFANFAKKFNYDDDKLVDIVRKTWRKMSPQAHEAALAIALPPREQHVVARALGS